MWDGRLHALEGLWAQGVTSKIPVHQAPGRVTDDQRVWRRQALEPSRHIGRVPQRQLFLSLSCPYSADHDESRVDAQAHGQAYPALLCQAGVELLQGLQHPQPGSHRALGIILVRQGVAEVDEQAIAEILGDMALKVRDHLGAGVLIGPAGAFAQEVTVLPLKVSQSEDEIRQGMIIGTRLFNENPNMRLFQP
jgi:hypothetical protein